MLAFSSQARHPCLAPSSVVDLHLIRPHPHLHSLADQPAVHRIGVVANPDRTAGGDSHPLPGEVIQTACRQRAHHCQLFSQALLPGRIAPGHNHRYKALVLFPAGKITATPQQQFLLNGPFQAVMGLFHIPVLVCLSCLSATGAHPEVSQQRLIALGELFPLQVLDCRREPVGPVLLGQRPQLPQRVLKPQAEALKRLTETQRGRLPSSSRLTRSGTADGETAGPGSSLRGAP